MSKFLSYEERLIIAKCLQENASFGEISKELGKDRTTIAKEIKKYSYDKKTGRPGYPYNPCRFRVSCKAKKICGSACSHQSAYKCSLCSECSLHCPDFEQEVCSVKNKPPYVCNGCRNLPKCTLLKRIYDPADAHEMAHHAISESRVSSRADGQRDRQEWREMPSDNTLCRYRSDACLSEGSQHIGISHPDI